MERNTNIDALRLIAALGIISLHVGAYPEVSSLTADIIRSTFRWCVPFFFMVTGYYLADAPSPIPKVLIERLVLPFRLFVVASMVFVPLLLAQQGIYGFNLLVFVRGTYVHLWYLTALLLSLLAFVALPVKRYPRSTDAVAVLITVAFVAANYYFAATGQRYDNVMFIRELSGFPAILIGGYLRTKPLKQNAGRILLAISVLILIAEIVIVRSAGWNASEIQFFISSVPMAAGLLCVALSEKQIAPTAMANAGRNEGLGIYLYHPAAIYIAVSILAGRPRSSTDGAPGLATWAMAAFITCLGLFLLKRVLPRFREILDGKFADTSREKGAQKSA